MLANTSPTIEIVREGDQWNMTFKVDSFSVARYVISLLFGVNLNKIKTGIIEDKQDHFQDWRRVSGKFSS